MGMRLFMAWVVCSVASLQLVAQSKEKPKRFSEDFINLGVGFWTQKNMFTAGYQRNWHLYRDETVPLNGSKVGIGAKFMGFIGEDVYFMSAPSSLYDTPVKVDSLLGSTPYIYSVNSFVSYSHVFFNKLELGVALDIIGVSFGPTGTPTFISDGVEKVSEAKPTTINLFLGGARDVGTVNVGFSVKYKVQENVAISLTYDTLKTELTTTEIEQTTPSLNVRFRHKANFIGVGGLYYF